jgi:hypothetical protein
MLERPDVVLLYGDAEIIDGDGAPVHPSYYGLHGLPHPEGDIRGALLEKNVVCAPTAMLRMSLRDRFYPIGPPAVWEDWWMYVHAAQAGPVAYLDGADVAYRVQGTNMHAGLTGVEHLRFLRREMPFRRWLLTETDLEGCTADEVVSAFRAFEWHAASIVGAGLSTPDELVPVGSAERDRSVAAQHAATAAHAAGDHAAAVKSLVRALAWNPQAPVRPALDSALAQARAAAHLPPADVRGAVVLVRADELRHDPTLLATYAQAFGVEDDVTLVIDAAGWTEERVLDELVPLAERHGLGDGGPDAVVLTDGRPWPRARLIAMLAAHATADSLRACHETSRRVAA